MNARSFFKLLACALPLVWAVPSAHPQSFPNRPIRIIVPFAPGGGTDIIARVIGAKMAENLGQSVIVENRAGGNTLIATEALVHAPPDGYTFMLQTNNLASNPTLYKGRLSFDTRKDLAPITLAATLPHVLVVNPAVPARTLQEYIALAKAKPGTTTFGSAGSGTVNHLTAELLRLRAEIDIVHVPYKGSAPLMPDLLANNVNSLFAAQSTVTQFIKEGKLRALAVTTPRRSGNLPDVPTVAELGFPGFDMSSWIAFFAPGGTPDAVIEKLNAEINKTLKDPGVRSRLSDYEMFGTTPRELAAFLDVEIDKHAKLIAASGARID